ncbi:hypothetical protein [Gloeothece verrucosa]|uniref:DUF8082 domain-containing protein n=1 Tax=Gloeothece verrucosa (strain PCC 7822) TaxID=497965 RepID=E0U8D8_GLOV7|nr:hypothetical protein [Gloeothece verrucosa]ADN12574.1 hypothetical protein Cyan7822_0535 [Gloeothece verrucosa PCC 7822]
MFFLQAKDFISEDILNATTNKVLFQGKWLIKSRSFAKHLHQKALTACREDLEAGKLSILVESQVDLTIWIEKPEEDLGQMIKTLSNPLSNLKTPDQVTNSKTAGLVEPSISQERLVAQFPTSLEPEFIEFCRLQLIEYIIAPIAERLLERTLKKYPDITPQQLIELLASKIPFTLPAEKFKKTMTAFYEQGQL